MKSAFSSIILIAFCILFSSSTVLAGAEEGLQCPPGWTNNKAALGNDLIKQCIAPTQDAFIELYAAPGAAMQLNRLLDVWVNAMNQKGMPFQQFLSEVPGNVSGEPALTRGYLGTASNGIPFESSLVACRHNGVNYIFQALYKSGDHQLKRLARQSMNEWFFPDIAYGNNTPYSQPQDAAPPANCCFAYGLWNITNTAGAGSSGGVSAVILPDSQLWINNRTYTWACKDSRTISVGLPASMGYSDTWTINADRTLMTGKRVGKGTRIAVRQRWNYTYKGVAANACRQ